MATPPQVGETAIGIGNITEHVRLSARKAPLRRGFSFVEGAESDDFSPDTT